MIVCVKALISLVILCITSYIGIEMANNLKSREIILTESITFFKLLQNEMLYMANSLPVAFEISRQKLKSELKDVIGAIGIDYTKIGTDISIEENINKLECLKDYDKTILISTLKNLGRSDLESQNNIIENAINIISEQIKEANEEKKKNSKVYKTVGTITGLLIVVILI